MNTKHVTSLEISKQLAEAGIVIKSEYVWCHGDLIPIINIILETAGSEIYPAPIATELLERLPDGCEYGVNLVKLMSGYGVELTSYKTMPYDRLEFIQDKNPCDTLALLLIRLTKDGLI
jgi:hypothetical protein